MTHTLQQQIIARALELLSEKSKWTSRAVARDAEGRACASRDQKAVRFCAVGALSRAAYEVTGNYDNYLLVGQIENAILSAGGEQRFSLPLLNDHRGYEAIVSMFRSALAAAK